MCSNCIEREENLDKMHGGVLVEVDCDDWTTINSSSVFNIFIY